MIRARPVPETTYRPDLSFRLSQLEYDSQRFDAEEVIPKRIDMAYDLMDELLHSGEPPRSSPPPPPPSSHLEKPKLSQILGDSAFQASFLESLPPPKPTGSGSGWGVSFEDE